MSTPLSKLRRGLHSVQIDLETKLKTFESYTPTDRATTLRTWAIELSELRELAEELIEERNNNTDIPAVVG